MDEYTVDAFANRDEPIPLLTVTPSDDVASGSEYEASDNEGRRQRLRRKISASSSKLKEKAQEMGFPPEITEGKLSLQDRLFTKLLQQLVPTEEPDSGNEAVVDRRSSKYVKRPAFSLPLMTNNFRRFNARIGIVFVFQNRLIRLFTWKTPSHTLSFLSVYTFVCLDPYLLVIIPLAVLLLFIMVPAFLIRHPPPPSSASMSSTDPYSYRGPALAPPRTIKPASETSKDFFRNMRDLQNSMADFATLHDSLISMIAPLTNFSNEVLSSAIYFNLTIATVLLFIAARLLPWRFLFLVAGYTLILAGHPTVQEWLYKTVERIRAKAQVPKPDDTPTLFGYPIPQSLSIVPTMLSSLSAITLDSAPEIREVEIFELQHRPLIPLGSIPSGEWTPRLFTPTPYDPLSPLRISGDRPRGTRFFEDVQPPRGWSWQGKKWELDLEAREWVSERLVTGVEFDVSASGGTSDSEFGGWVWDLPPISRENYGDEDEMWLAYGGGSDDIYGGGGESRKEKKRKIGKKELEKEKKAREERRKTDWEEARGMGRTGEWRRRRWIRTVKRIGFVEDDGGAAGKGR